MEESQQIFAPEKVAMGGRGFRTTQEVPGRLPIFFKEVSFPCRDTLPPSARNVYVYTHTHIYIYTFCCFVPRAVCDLTGDERVGYRTKKRKGPPTHANTLFIALVTGNARAILTPSRWTRQSAQHRSGFPKI